jgi:iron-sulfur cluster repair protein YtfE (RIC family)
MLEHGQTEAAYLFPSVLNGSAIEPAVTASLRDSGEKLRAELESLRVLTDGYSVPEWACNSVRATMDALSRLDETTSTHTKTVFETLLARVS